MIKDAFEYFHDGTLSNNILSVPGIGEFTFDENETLIDACYSFKRTYYLSSPSISSCEVVDETSEQK